MSPLIGHQTSDGSPRAGRASFPPLFSLHRLCEGWPFIGSPASSGCVLIDLMWSYANDHGSVCGRSESIAFPHSAHGRLCSRVRSFSALRLSGVLPLSDQVCQQPRCPRYDQRMLAVLAAVVPIVTSIYAAGSVLVEHAARGHEARVYARVDRWYRDSCAALDHERLGVEVFNRLSTQLNERRGMLLAANGLDPTTGTYTHMDRLVVPEARPPAELRRQWALLFGSVVGIVLLALDAS